MIELIKKYRISLFFMLRFIGSYLILNFAYSVYLDNYYPGPDPATVFISKISGMSLNWLGYENEIAIEKDSKFVLIRYQKNNVLAVYEGCNALNVQIIFIAFIFAYWKRHKLNMTFVPAGLIIIYLINVLRIDILFFAFKYVSDYAYFIHKYLLTALIYLVVFVMWAFWVYKIEQNAHNN